MLTGERHVPARETTVTCTVGDSAQQTASGSFTVTVQDTNPPSLTGIPGDQTIAATSPSGANVSFGLPSASDTVDPSPSVSCSRSPGHFPVGSTTVTCTATDGSGNTDSGSFTVTVTPYVGPPPPGPGPPPTGAPVLSVPSGVSVEATGPSGSVVNYGFVSASDGEDGQLPASCSPASGQTFPLGQTTVTCSATDSDGHTATKSFVVSVTDHTDPVLQLPPDLWIQTTEASLPRTDSRITTFLGAAAADDLVDSDPAIAHNAPATLPAGETVVTFTATDSSGNTATGTAKVTISPDPPPTGGDDRRPPANVSNIKAKLGDKSVRITWKNPADGDFDHVLVSRQPGKSGEPSSVVYEGRGASLVDKGLEVGTQYRYLLVTYDRAGNHPAGVALVAVGRRQLLRRPADGAVVRRPPTLGWVRITGAGYYNVQLWYAPSRASAAGTAFRKVLSAWPTASKLQLEQAWTYARKRYTLKPGIYRWFVWPGIGSRPNNDYGDLIGRSEFRVVKRR